MATPNFNNKNASKIFACEIEEEFDCEDLKDNIRAETDDGVDMGIEEVDNNRNYHGTIIKKIYYERGKWGITISLIVRSAYYSGVNLDWYVEVEDLNAGEAAEWKEMDTPEYIDRIINSKIKKIEKVYKDFSTPLKCLGVFSSGEAVYENA